MKRNMVCRLRRLHRQVLPALMLGAALVAHGATTNVFESATNTPADARLPVRMPGVDARKLPAWGFYARGVQRLAFERVQLIGTPARKLSLL